MRQILRVIRSQIQYTIILPYLALTVVVMLAGASLALLLVSRDLQERFDNLPIEMDGETIYGCFGPYVVDGKFAGLYNRFARDGFIAFNALVGAVVGT